MLLNSINWFHPLPISLQLVSDACRKNVYYPLYLSLIPGPIHMDSIKNFAAYLWWAHPENRETWSANFASSASLNDIEISLRRRALSDGPPRQYLKTIKSEIGFMSLDMLIGSDFVASLFSESDETSNPPAFTGLPPLFVWETLLT